MKRVKTKYFKINKGYFNFINKNKLKIDIVSVMYTRNKRIKLIYI